MKINLIFGFSGKILSKNLVENIYEVKLMLNLESSLFGMPSQKYMKLTKHFNFRKKLKQKNIFRSVTQFVVVGKAGKGRGFHAHFFAKCKFTNLWYTMNCFFN